MLSVVSAPFGDCSTVAPGRRRRLQAAKEHAEQDPEEVGEPVEQELEEDQEQQTHPSGIVRTFGGERTRRGLLVLSVVSVPFRVRSTVYCAYQGKT